MQLVRFWMVCFTLHSHRVTIYRCMSSTMEEYIATMEEHNGNESVDAGEVEVLRAEHPFIL